MISMDSEKTTETQWLKKVLVSFTFIDNEIEKVIEILQHDLYDSLLMYGDQAAEKTQKESP